jgi:hypothetical protein
MIEVKKDLEDELRGALIEAKESIEGKRKFLPGQANKFERNTLDNLINEMKALETKAK